MQPADIYIGLRSRLLKTTPLEVGIEPSVEMPNVWGVLMEFWVSQGIVTLVSLADGTTSLYFSNGGGILGSGEHQKVANASKQLVTLAERYFGRMAPTNEFPLPSRGKMQFFILTYSGALTLDVREEELTHSKSEFSPLFLAANDVVSQVRMDKPDR